MRIFATVLLLLSMVCFGEAQAACVDIPRDAADPAVTACETYASYTFQIAGKIYTYNKKDFRENFKQLLSQWAQGLDIDLQNARVDFWLSVPEANPAATQARAVMRSGNRKFIFFLPVHPDLWALDQIGVAILGPEEFYPNDFGHRAGSLLVKRHKEGSDEDLNHYLTRFDAGTPTPFSPGWSQYQLPIFAEYSTKVSISSDPDSKNLVERVELNYIMEWISLRERVFAFSVIY